MLEWSHLNLAVFLDTSLEEMLRNGQLPRLIFYLETYSARFEKVYVISHDEKDMQSLLPSRCFHLHTGNLPAGKFLYPIMAPLVFRRELAESDVYRVLGLFLRSMIPSVFASLIYARPIVATYQYRYSEFAFVEGRSPIVVLLTSLKEKVGLYLVTRIIVTTRNLKEYISKQLQGKEIWLIPNGVILELFSKREKGRPSKSSDKNILFVGRLTKQKNISSLLQAIQKIGKVKLTIVGEGPLRRELSEYSNELGLNVRFEGYVPHDQLKGYYHAADVFVLPSLIEGHPKVLLEAMACGLPVIGTNVEGTREIITHKYNGLLCGTDPPSIRTALKRLLEDPELAARLGENARRLVAQEYDLKVLLSRETDLMADLVLSRTG
jgi:glycosyltransferase involved in cell wall biosynthesis